MGAGEGKIMTSQHIQAGLFLCLLAAWLMALSYPRTFEPPQPRGLITEEAQEPWEEALEVPRKYAEPYGKYFLGVTGRPVPRPIKPCIILISK